MTQHQPLFLVGAAKAGTTSLAMALAAHPGIAELAIKEPGHYCRDLHETQFSEAYTKLLAFDETRYFQQSTLSQRHIAFVASAENYRKLQLQSAREQPEARYVLDASTAYLYSTTAAAEIHAAHPQAKIIVTLRNPISRAYSHYNMARKYGMEQRMELDAFAAESTLERAQWGVDECYLELGKYADQLQRYFDVFDPSQILILFHEDLKHRPEVALARIATFLDLEPFQGGMPDAQNKAEVPRSKSMGAIAGAFSGHLKDRIPPTLKRLGKRILFSTPHSIDSDARSFLVHYFAAENKKLQKLLNIDLKHWK